MRFLRVLVVVTLLLISATFNKAFAAMPTLGSEYYTEVTCTSPNQTLTFGFSAQSILIVNTGANPAHYTLKSSVAVVGSPLVPAGKSVSLRFQSVAPLTMGLFCGGGDSVVRVYAYPN